MTAIYGPSESGKTELINLFAGMGNRHFQGNCVVLGWDLMQGRPLPSQQVGLCLDEDHLE